ncbi:hypothetical protein A5712_07155 [Mycobacterium sp. E2327]|uniref:hypothetical protein n=1 Tax=Mycobacterium sp. E2327 TaxID=1834132 RepID=UPI0007FDC26F|nr:hypothetical protein [Mycobacterium sp. E2327]OBI12574.1 hypothetical protein A5712_07155 [Mycobacterium sp. E2327]
MQPFELTLPAAAREIRVKALPPVEPETNAFSNVTAELAANAAAAAERKFSGGRYRGPRGKRCGSTQLAAAVRFRMGLNCSAYPHVI